MVTTSYFVAHIFILLMLHLVWWLFQCTLISHWLFCELSEDNYTGTSHIFFVMISFFLELPSESLADCSVAHLFLRRWGSTLIFLPDTEMCVSFYLSLRKSCHMDIHIYI